MTATARALLRIREEMIERGITQTDLAEALGCSQSRIAKIFAKNIRLRLEDVEVLARRVGLTLSEVVRDRGLEFCAELTPTELRVLERIRRRPRMLDGIMIMLDLQAPDERRPQREPESRRKRGRPLNSAKPATSA